MGMGLLKIQVFLITKDNLKMIKDMEKENRNGMMVKFGKENG